MLIARFCIVKYMALIDIGRGRILSNSGSKNGDEETDQAWLDMDQNNNVSKVRIPKWMLYPKQN